MPESVEVQLEVTVTPEVAFAAFTERLAAWWPRAYTWSRDALEAIGIEPRVGGHCYEIGPGGFRCDWGTVFAWAPGERLSFAWQISPGREPVLDLEQASLVDVYFTPTADGATRVRLVHSRFERHGSGSADYRAAMGSERGWPWILEQYRTAF